MLDRRRDHATSNLIAEALRMKNAFGDFAAHTFLRRHNVAIVTAVRAIAGRYDPRQRPG
jgi:hypothetical protein